MASPASSDRARRIVAVYPYHDEGGTLLYEVVRFEPKSFAQRRPDGNCGHIWGLNGVRRILYRLPELLAAPRQAIVFIPEGEKDADRLRSVGLTATTSGAAGSWRPEFAEYFKGRDGVVLPDNDGHGLAHAGDVARSLHGIAKRVRVVWLPGLPPGGDVSDWLDGGHTVDELHSIVEATPVFVPGENPADRLTTEASDESTDRPEVDRRIAALALLDPIAYDRARELAAREMGIRVSTLDEEVLRRRPRSGDAQGQALDLPDVKPWPDPVDGAEVLAEVKEVISGHVTMHPHAAVLTTLWTALTHAHDCFHISPLLAITSPEPGCGKSTLLILLGALVPRPLAFSNVTVAAAFRAIEKFGPTVLVDEADTFLKDNDELRGVLNSGWLRASAYIVRTAGDDFEPRKFTTWAAKAIACIGKLPLTLADRSIEILLTRQTAEEAGRTKRLRPDRLDEFEPVCRRLARWVEDNRVALQIADPDVPGGLVNRRADNLRPLLALADLAGGDWPTRARAAALTLAAGPRDESAAVMLLADLKDMFENRETERLTSAEIVEHLGQMEDRPWPEWSRGKPITARGVARLLARFDVMPQVIRVGSLTARGYLLGDLSDAFSRYLSVGENVTAKHAPRNARFEQVASATGTLHVTDEIEPKGASEQLCYAVADTHVDKAGGLDNAAECAIPTAQSATRKVKVEL